MEYVEAVSSLYTVKEGRFLDVQPGCNGTGLAKALQIEGFAEGMVETDRNLYQPLSFERAILPKTAHMV